jgi:selenocysteine-specific elongation factor
LIEQQRLVRLGEKVTYHANVLDKVRKAATEQAKANGSITAAELRDALGVTRKYSVAILEYLDDMLVTKRLGDKHVLR